ncbi:hypothetical protein BSK48_27320 [Paenibacillus odorifer]|uniref:hypothetical protein n=1 Tax=Paenibacillus odorifer TaxID=189426 RepID=UPI00096DCCF0|nr:hypothetical protein [Paenibacillus odorifer]OMD63155.1 hypothetical protein BSK48_27320 [Paenibacillus odorifer]
MAEVQALIDPLLPVEVEGFFALLFGCLAETAEMKGTSALLSSYPAEIAEVKGTFALFLAT